MELCGFDLFIYEIRSKNGQNKCRIHCENQKRKTKRNRFNFFDLFYFYFIEYYHTIISASVL